MSGRVFSSDGYRFGFNNQEKDSELGDAYAFEYRIHDARLGRFLSVDPLAPKFPYYSSYQFAGNCVIFTRELEGLEPADNLNGTEENPVPTRVVHVMSHLSFWEKAALFGSGFVVSAVVTTVVTAAIVAVSSPLLTAAAVVYGAYQLGKGVYEVSSGKRLWSGKRISQRDRWLEAGGLAGGLVGAKVGIKLGKSVKMKIESKVTEPPSPSAPESTPAEINKPSETAPVTEFVDPNTKPALPTEHLDLFETAMNKAGFKSVPENFRQIEWVEGNYRYTVRGHGSRPNAPAGSNSANGPIYRISRQQTGIDPLTNKVSPLEYLDPVQNKWITVEGLKQSINEVSANNTHIPNKFVSESK